MGCLSRFRPFFVILCCLAPWFAPATAGARAARAVTAAVPEPPAAVNQGRKKKRRKHGKVGSLPGRSTATAHRRERRHHAPPAGTPKQPAKLALVQSPGPAQTPAALHAMDDVRRLQIERAASAARRDDVTNRWDTVNFLISGVDEQRYPEAAFWKVLSCYRRGRITEGDSTRQRCHLSAADVHALDGERSVAMLLTSRPGMAAPMEDARLAAAAPGRPEGMVNNAAYTGPGPTPDPTSATAP